MNFHGHVKSSFIDYPDKIATVFFVKGCNFRCKYCHNSELLGDWKQEYDEKYVFDYLEKRKKYIDAVCLSGGEITLYDGIDVFLQKVKDKGFLTKIDTNGTNPSKLKKLIDSKCLDYIAMDVKAPMNKYDKIVDLKVDTKKIIESINLIRKSNIRYEFRTTVCQELLNISDISEIIEQLNGAETYVLQNFRDSDNVLVGKGKLTPYSEDILFDLKKKHMKNFKNIIVR